MSWRDSAACLGMNLDWWFPDTSEHAVKAKAICKVCPVIVECRTYAATTHQTFGIWAGIRAKQVRGYAPAEPTCRLAGCERERRSDGLCKRHYDQKWRRQRMLA